MSMPDVGTAAYEALIEETGGAAANPGFNYEAHVAATRGTPHIEPEEASSGYVAPADTADDPPNIAPVIDNAGETSPNPSSSMSSAVAALSQAERDNLYAQVGDVMYNSGFNLAGHIAANTSDGVFIAPSNDGETSTSAADIDWLEIADSNDLNLEPWLSSDSTSNIDSTSSMSDAVASLSRDQLDNLYAQVGDAMYAPGFSLAGHIAANTIDGVFVAPSNDESMPLTDNDIDWLEVAETNGLNLDPWLAAEVQSSDGSLKLGEIITAEVITGMSTEVAALSETHKADLFSQVGTAMYSPGFNLAAHIAANMQDGNFVPPTTDNSFVNEEESSVDWLDWVEDNSVDLTPWQVSSLDITAAFGVDEGLINLPAEDSEEWIALMEETGGAVANEGFNYAAHIAAITSQQVLTELSEVDVLLLIKETGITNFEDFDLEAHNAVKSEAITKSDKIIKAKKLDTTSDDILVATESNDLIDLSKATKDKKMIATGAGNDIVKGSSGDNVIIAGSGDDRVDGGNGIDSVVISDKLEEVSITFDSLSSEWVVASGIDGTDRLANVERVVFEDKALALDTDGVAGKAYRIYKAAFDRDPMSGDTAGLGYWIEQSDEGMDQVEIASRFIDSEEFKSTYGESPSNGEFITALYSNVLDREPDDEGFDWWVDQLENNPDKSWEKVLADFSESDENIKNVEALVQNGIVYDIFTG